jgi:UDP-N-acetylmuramate dehydrogenase
MPLDREAKNWLKHRFGQHVKFDEPMSKHTYFRIGGTADAYLVPPSRKDFVELIQWAKQRQQPYLVIGDGTNLLVRDAGIRGLVIALTKCLNHITCTEWRKKKAVVSAMAGAKLQALCKFAIKSGLAGMNFAIGIPGTVGGGIMMNAGTARGSMGDVLDSIEVLLPDGQTVRIGKEKLEFKYRNLSLKKGGGLAAEGKPIILEGRFQLRHSDAGYLKREAQELLNIRKKTQPTNYPCAGCFFKNPPAGKTAGELIELAGLKGKRIGGAEVSTKHANYIINSGNATAGDVIALMEMVQKIVSQTFNIELKPEVKIVGPQA